MKKNYLIAVCLLMLSTKASIASLMVENINKKLSADTTAIDVMFGPIVAPLFTFNYFAIPGSISVTGKINSEFSSTLLAEPIGGGNYTPTRLYNNTDFTSMNNYARSPIFIHNNNLTFDNKFKGKGNNYLGARVIFTASKDTIYMWMLVNLNAAGTELNIIKLGYDDESGKRPVTGTEGQSAPTGMLEQLGSALKIFPQPAQDVLNLELPQEAFQKLSIFNLSGEEMYLSSNWQPKVDVHAWPRGIYLVRVETLHGILTRKVVID